MEDVSKDIKEKIMKITIVAGARPNFIKIASIIAEIEKAILEGFKLSYRLVHTGQHFDNAMSALFFEQLNIPEPDINLEVSGGSGTHGKQLTLCLNLSKNI